METYDEITQKHMLTVKEMGILEGEIDIAKEDLKEISQELGMTEEGWDYVMREAQKKITLAQSHLKHKSYRECLKAAQDALLLNPYILGARGIQAKACLLIAINEEDDDFLKKARTQAEVTLAKESTDRNAIEVMGTVSVKGQLVNLDKKKNPNKKLAIILGMIIVALIGVVGVYFIANNAETEQSNSELENIELRIESGFERLEKVMSIVEGRIANVSKGEVDLEQLNKIKDQLGEDLTLKERYDLEIELLNLLSKIIYSDYFEIDNINDLRVELEGAENRIKTERKNYNDAILESGLKIEKL